MREKNESFTKFDTPRSVFCFRWSFGANLRCRRGDDDDPKWFMAIEVISSPMPNFGKRKGERVSFPLFIFLPFSQTLGS